MATTQDANRVKAGKHKRGALYPPGHQPSNDPFYCDDTLDAYPPLRRLFPGKPTPEAMEAARQLAAKRGYPMPHFPDETSDTGDGPQTPGSPAISENGAVAEQSQRSAAPSTARKK